MAIERTGGTHCLNRRRSCWGVAAAIGFAAALLSPSLALAQAGEPEVVKPDVAWDAPVRDGFDISTYTIQRLTLPPQGTWDAFDVRVILDQEPVTLMVHPHLMRADGFKVLVQDATGLLHEVEAPAPVTFRGLADFNEDSRVHASLVFGGFQAIILTADGHEYAVQPLAEVIPGADPSLHVVYAKSDIVNPGGICGNDDAHDHEGDEGIPMTERGAGDRITDIAFDADFEYYSALGNSVSAVVNDIESIMNGIESIYETECDITYEVTTIVVRTAEPDPYGSSSPGTLLNQFDAEWSANMGSVRRDLAHLFTNKNLSGGIIGIASLGVVCSVSDAYGLSQSRYTANVILRRSLTAHECGHNWNAQHCDGQAGCAIMCSANGGCGVPQPTTFGTFSANQIISFRNTRGCLITEPAPSATPFIEEFSAASFDTTKWVYLDGVTLSTASVNPPSTPRTCMLNAVGSGVFDDDELRSNFILLAGVTNPTLSYFVENRGVPMGGQLIVEVWQSNLRWVELNRLTSNGTTETAFTQHTHTLSGSQVHNEFRVRFRVDVSSTSANWHVDNVYVGTALTAPAGACCLPNGTCIPITEANCNGAGGNWQGAGTNCGTPCPQPPGACCLPSGGCASFPNAEVCAGVGGVWQGSGSLCGEISCTQPAGACCLPTGICVSVADAAACGNLSGAWQGAGTSCDNIGCPQPSGACCLPDGTCVIRASAAACQDDGGNWQGDGSNCSGQTCPVQTGACCLPDGQCILMNSSAECLVMLGTWQGAGTTCSGQCAPPCACDWNDSDSVDSSDYFDFLTDFFNNNADYNNSGATDSSDFFDFLACFLSGCP